ncbi:MAG TPA: TonB-dependent receptor [Gemmatirosa sp.]
MPAVPFPAAVVAPAAQPAGAVVTGRVVDATAAPVAGAVVRVLTTAADARGAVTQTDAAGRFTLRGIVAGVVRLDVRRLGFVPRIVGDVVVRAGKPAEVRVVLESAAVGLAGVTVRPGYFAAAATAATPVSTAGFTTEEIRRAPGVQEDVVRAVGVLPGIAPTTENRNDLVVRGGAPVENLFVVDGLEVPNINTFAAQGSTGGPESVLPLDFVRSAAISTGGFGARYGDRASSVVDVELRDGTRERIAGQLDVSVLEAAALAEGPLGGTGSFLAGVRRSYLGPVFRWINAGVIPSLEDATLKAVVRPSPRDELSWFGVAAKGTVGVDAATDADRYGNRIVVAPNETQYFTGLTWRHRLARGLLSTTVGRTSAAFATEQDGPLAYGGLSETLFRAHTTEAEDQLRATLVWSPRGAHDATFEVGTIAKYADRLHYDVYLPGFLRRDAYGVPHTLRADTTFTAFRDATYAQADVRLAPRLRAVIGLRADDYAFLANAVRVAPRAAVTWTVDGVSTVTLAGGRYWQAPQPVWLAGDASNLPDAPGGGVRPFRADHLVLGYERLMRPDVRLRIEGYAKRYADYPARVFRPSAVLQPGTFDDALTEIPFGLEPLASVGTGRVAGAEAFVQKSLSDLPVYGLAALSVSRATFTALQGGPTPGAYDIPVIATVLAGWRPGPRWELSSRVRAASGAPTTPFVTSGPLYGALDPLRYDQGPRRAPFFSLDARVDRRFTRRSGRELDAYVDLQNVTGRHNWFSEGWAQYAGRPYRITTFGRLPSAGMNWVF